MSYQPRQWSPLFLRLALSATMLSAVADRFGFWKKNAAWGNWKNFEQYTRQLTFFLPEFMSRCAAYAATFSEIILSVLLILGWNIKRTAQATGILLLIFAVSMIFALGIKAPLDYSVWVGSAAAFLLAAFRRKPDPHSISCFAEGMQQCKTRT